MENALRKIVRDRLDQNFDVEKCFVKNGKGKFTECYVVVYRKGRKDMKLKEGFNTLAVDNGNVAAVIEVKSFADKTGLDYFQNFLRNYDLVGKGFFVGIGGEVKNVSNGVDLERRIFIFSKTSGGNVKKKERVRLEEHNVNVLQKFIKALTDELIDRR